MDDTLENHKFYHKNHITKINQIYKISKLKSPYNS